MVDQKKVTIEITANELLVEVGNYIVRLEKYIVRLEAVAEAARRVIEFDFLDHRIDLQNKLEKLDEARQK
jgi:hypothetical protein